MSGLSLGIWILHKILELQLESKRENSWKVHAFVKQTLNGYLCIGQMLVCSTKSSCLLFAWVGSPGQPDTDSQWMPASYALWRGRECRKTVVWLWNTGPKREAAKPRSEGWRAGQGEKYFRQRWWRFWGSSPSQWEQVGRLSLNIKDPVVWLRRSPRLLLKSCRLEGCVWELDSYPQTPYSCWRISCS